MKTGARKSRNIQDKRSTSRAEAEGLGRAGYEASPMTRSLGTRATIKKKISDIASTQRSGSRASALGMGNVSQKMEGAAARDKLADTKRKVDKAMTKIKAMKRTRRSK